MPTPRKTKVIIDGKEVVLNSFFEENQNIANVNYSTFTQRCKSCQKRNLLNNMVLYDAISMQEEWASFYGGGKYKEFTYHGEFYKEFIGVTFRSLSVFLLTVGEYDKYQLIKSRLLRSYSIDDAIFKPTVRTEVGRIYLIECSKTDKKYVGQTIHSIEERFKEHLALNDETELRKAFRTFGKNSFFIKCLEDNIPNKELHKREQYYIEMHNAIAPNGFNHLNAQPSKVSYSKSVEWKGNTYPSRRALLKKVQKERPDLPSYIIEKRIRTKKALPQKARKHSSHPMAGTNIFRRWLSLQRRNLLCSEWATRDEKETGFSDFYKAVGDPPFENAKLMKLDDSLSYASNNFRWVSSQEERELRCGQTITAFGKEYPTHSALANEFNLALSTLNNRISRGQTPEEAVSKQRISTKKIEVTYDGILFPSKNVLCRYVAEKYSITFGQAKDRWDRNLPFDKISQSKKCTVQGIDFKSESAAARHFGIKHGTFSKRRFLGWSLEEALGWLTMRVNRQYNI